VEQTPIPVARRRFREQAWREFQRALDPLAPPRLLPRATAADPQSVIRNRRHRYQ